MGAAASVAGSVPAEGAAVAAPAERALLERLERQHGSLPAGFKYKRFQLRARYRKAVRDLADEAAAAADAEEAYVCGCGG